MLNTREEILKYTRNTPIDDEFRNIDEFTTEHISNKLYISRSLTSQYLNSLHKEGKLIKIESRPVYYINKFNFEMKFNVNLKTINFTDLDELISFLKKEKRIKYNFEKLIGYDGSLSEAITQIKAAFNYPGSNKTNLLLYGEVGTGKLLLAKCAYEYLISLNPNKDIVLLVLDPLRDSDIYGKLTELHENKSLSEKHDEVVVVIKHANNLEDRKILDLINDREFYSVIDHKTHGLNCHFIFLIEDKELNQTNFVANNFPIKCYIPSYIERYIDEKEMLVVDFFKEQSQIINKNVLVSYGLFEYLKQKTLKRNLDDLRSIIQEICAKANLTSCDTEIKTGLNNLGSYNNGNIVNFQKQVTNDDKYIDVNYYQHANLSEELTTTIQGILNFYLDDGSSLLDAPNKSNRLMDTFCNLYVNENDNLLNNSPYYLYQQISEKIDDVLKIYSLMIPQSTKLFLSYYLFFVKTLSKRLIDWRNNNLRYAGNIKEKLVDDYPIFSVAVEKITAKLGYETDIELDDVAKIILYSSLVGYNNTEFELKFIAIIICHGQSTAKSLADTVNSLIGRYVFESFDMPLDTPMKNIASLVKKYINKFSINKDVLLLVDMGSLEVLGENFSDSGNNIYVINNVSTPLALQVGIDIVKNESIEYIIKNCNKNFSSQGRMFKNRKKSDAIVFISDNGKRMADRMRDIFVNSLPKNSDIEFMAMSKMEYESDQVQDKIAQDYNILMVSGMVTEGQKIQNFISFEDIIKQDNLQVIITDLCKHFSKDEIDEIRNNLIRNFSLENLIDNLSVLDAKKLLYNVEDAIKRLEKELNTDFSTDMLLGIYVHTCCMIERLVVKEPINIGEDSDSFLKENSVFVRHVRNAFAGICSHYGIEVTAGEIKYLYEYIENDTKRKELENE